MVYWNNIPAPYIVDRLNAVADRGHIALEAWFSSRTHAERNWVVDETSWRFPHRYLPSVNLGPYRIAVPVPLLASCTPNLLVSLYADPSFAIGTRLARGRNVRTAFWAEMTFDAWIQRRAWKEIVKRKLFSDVDGVIVGGEDGRSYALRYGTHSDRIHYVGQSIDVKLFSQGSELSASERHMLRDRLGLSGGVVFLYVGRLWRGKGLDTLLDAFAVLRAGSGVPVRLLIVGTGEEAERLQSRCVQEGLDGVVFLGYWPDLPKVYACADVFVFPSLGDPYGLVIDEAMACSLPVISTSSVGEVAQRIDDGVNGFIVPPGNSASLLNRMEKLAQDPELREQMKSRALAKVSGKSPEVWAEHFELAVQRILSMPPKTRRRRAATSLEPPPPVNSL